MPEVDIRDLVKNAVTLTGKIAARSGGGHEIHEGISKERSYASAGGKPIFLPRSGRGLHRVKSTLAEPIPGVDDALWNEARVRLLGQGFSVHRDAGSVLVGSDGATLSDTDQARARSTLLAAVFRSDDESFTNGVFSVPRFGAVATLTVLPSASNPKWSEDAWLTVEWVFSTSAMLRALARVSGLGLVPAKRSRAIKILVTEELWHDNFNIEADIADVAYLCGARPTIHLMQDDLAGAIRTDLSDAQPSQLLVLGPNPDETTISAFTARRGDADLHRGEVASASELDEWLRNSLPHLLGVGPALMPHPQVEPKPGRPRLPVAVAATCIHHRFHDRNVTYVQDRESDVWWTRDIAQHGTGEPTVFKSYKLRNDVLEWVGDHRADGTLIQDKHKGDEGIEMKGSRSHSCAFPESHLR